ncbi:uncharacterized protein LOC107006272 [Solanum pennellii]|uniref:Uncharacterized protein LOC107006272 n=1 Tax=Solanum pennellii TaxID=28526 RepID=A0ABM1FQS9_SOLPN|nr:uncharacterized protein LOC107006272 [Solanum pennellii]
MIEFEMLDLGMMYYFLGIEVKQYFGGIFTSEKKYVQEILMRFGMTNCKSVTIQAETGLKFEKDSTGKRIDNTFYKKIMGSLMYLTATRPDIIYYLSLVRRYMESSREAHFLGSKITLRYLQGIRESNRRSRSEIKSLESKVPSRAWG